MYTGYAVSVKSEKDASMKALDMIGSLRIYLESMLLDRCYSGQSIPDGFSEYAWIFITPKKNSRVSAPKGWRENIRRLINVPTTYLRNTSKEVNLKLNSLQTREQQCT